MRSKKVKTEKVVTYTLLIIVSLAMLMPLVVLFATSVRTYDDLVQNPTHLFGTEFSLDAFAKVLDENPYFMYLGNTLLITVVSIVGCCFTSAMVGYGFARFKAPGSKFLFALFMAGMIIPGQVLNIPMFEIYKRLGWINTFLPFIIPVWFGGGAFNFFLQRQFMKGLPPALMEAAEIDGCSEVGIFFRIVLPLSKPVITTIAVFTFINCWNDLYGPLLYLEDPSLWTLAKGNYMIYQAELGKQGVSGGSILPWNIISAANAISIVPIIILYFFAQRVFVEGIATTGIKG